MGEAVEARREAVVARESTKAAEDVATAAVDDAQDIGLQAGFKTLCQALLQMAPDFDVEALDTPVTMDVINALVSKAEAEIAKGMGSIAQAGGAEGTSSAATKESKAARAHPHIAEVAPTQESTKVVPIGGSVEVALVGDDVVVCQLILCPQRRPTEGTLYSRPSRFFFSIEDLSFIN